MPKTLIVFSTSIAAISLDYDKLKTLIANAASSATFAIADQAGNYEEVVKLCTALQPEKVKFLTHVVDKKKFHLHFLGLPLVNLHPQKKIFTERKTNPIKFTKSGLPTKYLNNLFFKTNFNDYNKTGETEKPLLENSLLLRILKFNEINPIKVFFSNQKINLEKDPACQGINIALANLIILTKAEQIVVMDTGENLEALREFMSLADKLNEIDLIKAKFFPVNVTQKDFRENLDKMLLEIKPDDETIQKVVHLVNGDNEKLRAPMESMELKKTSEKEDYLSRLPRFGF